MSKTQIDRARQIVGEQNSLDPGEVEQITGYRYTSAQLKWVMEVPFSEQTLEEWAQEPSFLFPGQLLHFKEMPPMFGYLGTEGWVQNNPFGRVTPRWYLFRRGALPHSHGMTWQEQQVLLGKKEERAIPSVPAVFFGHHVSKRAGLGSVVTSAMRCHGGRFAIMPNVTGISIYEQKPHQLGQMPGLAVEAKPIGVSIWL